jgi:predicted nucleic acid-binding protein
MIGLDTGFFVRLLELNEHAVALWNGIANGEAEAVCIGLTLFELERLALRGAIDRTETDVLLDALEDIVHVAWIGSTELARSAARVSHGTGLPSVDALIFSLLVHHGATTIVTTDDWSAAGTREVEILRI